MTPNSYLDKAAEALYDQASSKFWLARVPWSIADPTTKGIYRAQAQAVLTAINFEAYRELAETAQEIDAPWIFTGDFGATNTCGFCGRNFEHELDCVWLRIGASISRIQEEVE